MEMQWRWNVALDDGESMKARIIAAPSTPRSQWRSRALRDQIDPGKELTMPLRPSVAAAATRRCGCVSGRHGRTARYSDVCTALANKPCIAIAMLSVNLPEATGKVAVAG
ncbi:MAG: hypothetical protein U0Q16_35055 [Bryobacteraceae bacterium]